MVNATTTGNTTLDAPLSHINVHIRDGSALLLHAKPGYTIAETQAGPYELLVSLSSSEQAFGTAYVDDGESYPPGPSKRLTFAAGKWGLNIAAKGSFNIKQRLQEITLLGVERKPRVVRVGGDSLSAGQVKYEAAKDKLVISGLRINLNQPVQVQWQ